MLNGRPDNAVKNHWYSLMRSNQRKLIKAKGDDELPASTQNKKLSPELMIARGLLNLSKSEVTTSINACNKNQLLQSDYKTSSDTGSTLSPSSSSASGLVPHDFQISQFNDNYHSTPTEDSNQNGDSLSAELLQLPAKKRHHVHKTRNNRESEKKLDTSNEENSSSRYSGSNKRRRVSSDLSSTSSHSNNCDDLVIEKDHHLNSKSGAESHLLVEEILIPSSIVTQKLHTSILLHLLSNDRSPIPFCYSNEEHNEGKQRALQFASQLIIYQNHMIAAYSRENQGISRSA
jgi:hypothetical protein